MTAAGCGRRGRCSVAGDVVGVRSNPDAVLAQHSADRLDPELVSVGVDERHYFLDWRSS